MSRFPLAAFLCAFAPLREVSWWPSVVATRDSKKFPAKAQRRKEIRPRTNADRRGSEHKKVFVLIRAYLRLSAAKFSFKVTEN
jgi:hypothetical protein